MGQRKKSLQKKAHFKLKEGNKSHDLSLLYFGAAETSTNGSTQRQNKDNNNDDDDDDHHHHHNRRRRRKNSDLTRNVCSVDYLTTLYQL
jgi:hypothetical protein